MRKFDFIDRELKRRRIEHQHRRLQGVTPLPGARVEVNGRAMVDFCSNDYLGLSKHPSLQARAIQFSEKYGSGSTASRLICGSLDCFEAVERKLAESKGVEGALIFNSGFQANVSVIPALADRKSTIFSDALNHNSIIQGITLARCTKKIFRHNDLDHLQSLLEKNAENGASRSLIVTESVFSMDGDQTDIDRLTALAEAHDAILIVDEAHATGVLGENGMGLTAGKNVDVTVGTFGKALGSFGAYIACSGKIKDYLVNCCSGFIYTTALPPAVLGTIDAALDLVPQLTDARKRLHENATFLRDRLSKLGYDTGPSTTQIIPVLLGDEASTLAMARKLEEAGIFATAIRPPTVPPGESRIRLALSAAHTRPQIEALLRVFGE